MTHFSKTSSNLGVYCDWKITKAIVWQECEPRYVIIDFEGSNNLNCREDEPSMFRLISILVTGHCVQLKGMSGG